jgi:hypothetical protein
MIAACLLPSGLCGFTRRLQSIDIVFIVLIGK